MEPSLIRTGFLKKKNIFSLLRIPTGEFAFISEDPLGVFFFVTDDHFFSLLLIASWDRQDKLDLNSKRVYESADTIVLEEKKIFY